MATPVIRIGLIGCGTVGGAFASLLAERRADLQRELGADLVLSQVAVKHPERERPVAAGDNVIEVDALAAGRLVWRGAGAGGRATASAALADTAAAARALALTA